jgi:hypothetical protein
MHRNGDHEFLTDRFGKIKFVVVINHERHIVFRNGQRGSGHNINRREELGVKVDDEVRHRVLEAATAVNDDLGGRTNTRKYAAGASQQSRSAGQRG